MTEPRINLPVSKLEDEIERLQTRNDRLALLVRLMRTGRVVFAATTFLSISHGEVMPFHSMTNGIPDLTDEQWERLFKLERGEA